LNTFCFIEQTTQDDVNSSFRIKPNVSRKIYCSGAVDFSILSCIWYTPVVNIM